MSYKEKMSIAEVYNKLTGTELQKLIYGDPMFFKDAYKDWHPPMPVITQDKPGEIQFFRWGLIPPFAKYIDKGGKQLHPWDFGNYYSKTANAKVETLPEKSTWKRLYKKRRCLVLATGFFEFHHMPGKKVTYPHYITLKDYPVFAFGGLWDSWTDPQTAEEINSFTIITTKPNDMMKVIHNNPNASSGPRMPLMLIPEEWENWLDGELSHDEVLQFAEPFPVDGMQAVPVRQGLKKKDADANVEKILEPIEYPELGNDWRKYGQANTQAGLF